MSGPQRRFDPAELLVPGEPDPTSAESADALASARELEALASDPGIRPTDGFEDRVMAAIATAPAPRLVMRDASAVRGGRVGAFLVAIRDAWGVAAGGGRPMAVRMQALAFVLLVLVTAGAMAGVTALTVGALMGPDGPTVAPSQDPNPSSGPVVSPSPTAPIQASPSPQATATVRPSPSPEVTDTAEPTETAEPTKTPRPGETARPTRTPRPTETPEGSDDHGGGGGSGGGGSGGGDDGGGGPGPG